jgi:hypothetical protein
MGPLPWKAGGKRIFGQKHGEKRFLLAFLPDLHPRYDRQTSLNPDPGPLMTVLPKTCLTAWLACPPGEEGTPRWS